MPNYCYKTKGHYYFVGMYTAILPMIAGIYAICRLSKKLQSKANNLTARTKTASGNSRLRNRLVDETTIRYKSITTGSFDNPWN